MILAQRIIRPKASTSGKTTGKVYSFLTLTALRDFARKNKKVYLYVHDDGSEGTIRSGRKMRFIDAHVRNVTHSMKR